MVRGRPYYPSINFGNIHDATTIRFAKNYLHILIVYLSFVLGYLIQWNNICFDWSLENLIGILMGPCIVYVLACYVNNKTKNKFTDILFGFSIGINFRLLTEMLIIPDTGFMIMSFVTTQIVLPYIVSYSASLGWQNYWMYMKIYIDILKYAFVLSMTIVSFTYYLVGQFNLGNLFSLASFQLIIYFLVYYFMMVFDRKLVVVNFGPIYDEE